MCFFFTYRSYSYLENADKDLIFKLPDMVCFRTDDDAKLIHPWNLYPMSYYHKCNKESWDCTDYPGCLTEQSNKCIDFPTPVFKNLRWMLETEDYPDGEIFSLFFLGLLRGVRKKVVLVGDWDVTGRVQAFNLSRCIDYKEFNDLVPKHLKELAKSESCYNKDSIIIQSYGAMLDSACKNKDKFKPLPDI